MKKRLLLAAAAFLFLMSISVFTQIIPWFHWTLLPQDQMDEIIGEASGETAWNTILETGGYNQNRPASAYGNGTFYETRYIFDQLKKYGLPGAKIERFPGGEVWDGIRGELWEVTPMRQKLASYQDMTVMLASGSSPADVTAELVWVGRGTVQEMEGLDLAGKIVVTEGSPSSVHQLACLKKGAEGIIAISQSRPYFDSLQIPWRGIGSRRGGDENTKFAFYLPFREGYFLKERLLAKQKITVHAVVESETQSYEYQDIVCHIPGTDPDAGEVIFSAHLFEGYVKQGANDNKSGSAAILETARTLHALIESGRLPRPKRTIRFLWGPEYSGTGPWVKANRDLMEKTLCNINMDMVGEWLSMNRAFFSLMRTTYGHPHYINDVMENYYRYIGETNREKIQTRSSFPYKFSRRIVAPSGSDEPFVYAIEPHYGASDHEVFNDWGVQVPGIMMIAWPDQWYHTSGDRADKADPTQLKRVVIIGAAAAYTIANADEAMAVQIASETAANGTRRLGRELARAMEEISSAKPEDLAKAYKTAYVYMKTAGMNENATLASILELDPKSTSLKTHVSVMQKSLDAVHTSHFAALKSHAAAMASRWNAAPPSIEWTEEEKSAAVIVPRPTAKVKQEGYRGYQEFIDAVPEEQKKEFATSRQGIASTSELQCLIDGKHSILDIKHMLDAQYQRESQLKQITNFLEILKLAGLIEM